MIMKKCQVWQISHQMATGYTVIVSVSASIAAFFYLYVSGAFKNREDAV